MAGNRIQRISIVLAQMRYTLCAHCILRKDDTESCFGRPETHPISHPSVNYLFYGGRNIFICPDPPWSILFCLIKYIKVSPPPPKLPPSQISGVIKIMSSINPLCVSLCACVLYVCWRSRVWRTFRKKTKYTVESYSNVHCTLPTPQTLQQS